MAGVTYDYQFKGQLAKNFVSQFGSLSEDKFFMCLSGITGSTTDQRTDESETSFRQNLIVAKRIESDSSAILIPRYDWTEGISMDKISSDVDTSTLTKPFYVYDDNSRNVYICLDNNDNENGSNIRPNGTSTDPIQLTDGFEWKFLYTIPSGLEDFVDKEYIPVKQFPFYQRIANAYENSDQNQYEVQYEANLDNNIGSISGVSVIRKTGNLVFDFGQPRNNSNKIQTASPDRMTFTLAQNLPSGTQEYGLRILSGVASGLVRKIKQVNGREIKVGNSFPSNQAPQPTDLYEIGPIVNFSGDGNGAEGFATLKGDNTIDTIIMTSAGQNYSFATPSFSVTNQVFDYTLNALIYDPIGKDAVSELAAKRSAIGVRFEGSLDLSSDEASGIGNDFINIGILKNPKVAEGLPNAGELLNFDDFRTTTVLVREVSETGSLVGFDLDDSSKSYIVVGNSSGVVGELNGPLSLDVGSEVAGEIDVRNMAKPFIKDEILTVLSADKRDGTFTQLSKKLKVFETRFADTRLNIAKSAFRGSVGVVAKGVSDAANLVALDKKVFNRTSDSEAKIVSVTDLPVEDEFEIFLTDVKARGSTYGFNRGDNIIVPLTSSSPTDTVCEVLSVSEPQINNMSGELVYIQGMAEKVQRVAEQSEFIKIIFTF
tara:strand:- start:10228 stop:12195 length:1968 start_codon:yes stop_codon:yes gene_type:complete